MEVLDILDDVQRCMNGLQHKLDLVRVSITGKAYDVDVLMTRKEAAAFIGKSLRTLDRLWEEGRIKRFMVDGQIRYKKSNLLAYKGIVIEERDKAEQTKSELAMLIDRFK